MPLVIKSRWAGTARVRLWPCASMEGRSAVCDGQEGKSGLIVGSFIDLCKANMLDKRWAAKCMATGGPKRERKRELVGKFAQVALTWAMMSAGQLVVTLMGRACGTRPGSGVKCDPDVDEGTDSDLGVRLDGRWLCTGI